MSGSAAPVPTLEPLAIPLAGMHLVQASAGTGKTYTIGSLVLRLILEDPPGGGEPPTIDKILVVTFTNAATAELRGRIRDRLVGALAQVDGGPRVANEGIAAWLEGLAAGARRETCRGRLRAALRDFDDAAIFTIHGFCQRMLQEYAFESGVDFEAELVGDETELVQNAVRDFWARETYEAPALAVAWLQDAGKLNLTALEALGKALAGAPELPRLPAPAEGPAPGREDLLRLEDAYGRAWSAAAEAWRRGGPAALALVVEALDRKALNGRIYAAARGPAWAETLGKCFASRPEAMPEDARKVLGKLAAGRMTCNQNGVAPEHPFFDACATLVEAIEQAEAELEAWGMALRHGLDAWLREELPERKRRARQQSFDDLLHQLHRALRPESSRAPRLAARIRGRFPAALIDEFQDTDLVQYDIFRRIYAPGEAVAALVPGDGGSTVEPPLLFVGDPKQAIYAFRGADIFAYLRAVSALESGRHHTLSVNWRSDASLVVALNLLWQSAADRRPFLFEKIPFIPVTAHYGDRVSPRRPPLTLAYLPASVVQREPTGKVVGVDLARRMAARAAATAIGQLLREPPTLDRGDGPACPVKAGDLAVLVRSNREARRMQRVLRAHQIPSVLTSDDSVLDQPEAEELRQVLGAIVEPADARGVRAALVTTLLGQDAATIEALGQDERDWEGWIERFRAWQDTWQRAGFLPAIRQMLDAEDAPTRLLALTDGERRLTNFLHLAELLHAVAFDLDLGPAGLLAWYDRVREDPELRKRVLGETAQLRLESDAEAVRIATIHKAKGLEYAFVFCPFLWGGGTGKTQMPLRYHDLDGDGEARLDIGPRAIEAAQRAARLEGLAENLRILYVALTRARHGLWLAWGPFNTADRGALAYLLHAAHTADPPPADDASGALSAWSEAVAATAKATLVAAAAAETRDGDPLWRQLEGLAAAHPDLLAARWLGAADLRAASSTGLPGGAASKPLSARPQERRPRRSLYRSSFTGLTRAASDAEGPAPSDGPDHDALEGGEGGGALTVGGGTIPEGAAFAPSGVGAARDAPGPELDRVPLADMVAGARLGTGLHTLLERIDFGEGPDRWGDEARRLAGRRALPVAAVDLVVEALDTVLNTPLGAGALDFRLSELRRGDRINEMHYVLPVAVAAEAGRFAALGAGPGDGRAGSSKVGPSDLARAMRDHPGGALPEAYPWRLEALPARAFAGWLSGSLDLVFRRTGRDGRERWYLLDWKSNHLGPAWDDYAPERLAAAMAHHHYYLQAHLYTVALYRHLRRCLGGAFDYEADFGGVMYLFIRGMRPDRPGSGVVFDKPPWPRVEALDRLLHAGRVR